MNSKRKQIQNSVVCMSLALVVAGLSCKAVAAEQVGNMGSTGTSGRSRGSNSDSYNPNIYTPPARQQPVVSTQDGANKTTASQELGEVLQYALGGFQIYTGYGMMTGCPSPTCAMGAMLIANGATQILQGLENKDAAGFNGNLGCSLSNTCTTSGGDGGLNIPGQGTQIKTFEAAITNSPLVDPTTKEKIVKAAKGVFDNTGKFNPNATKFTGPDGKTYDASKMNSAADLQAAGFSAAEAKKIIDSANDIKDKMLAKAAKLGLDTNGINGLDDGGGAAAMAAAASKDDSSSGGGRGFGGLGAGAGGDGKRDPAALVAGMTKNFNGEPIGVAGDSIFLMMNRRYKLKTAQDNFLNASELLTPH